MGHPPEREGGQAGFDGCVCACACAGGSGGQLSHQGQAVAGEHAVSRTGWDSIPLQQPARVFLSRAVAWGCQVGCRGSGRARVPAERPGCVRSAVRAGGPPSLLCPRDPSLLQAEASFLHCPCPCLCSPTFVVWSLTRPGALPCGRRDCLFAYCEMGSLAQCRKLREPLGSPELGAARPDGAPCRGEQGGGMESC